MQLPNWFVRVVKPVYNFVQHIPLLDQLSEQVARYILSAKKPNWKNFRNLRQQRLKILEHKINQYGIIIQGLDQANQFIYQKFCELEQGRQGQYQKRIESAEQRIEFVRDECMFELRQVTGALPKTTWDTVAEQSPVKCKIVTPGVLDNAPLKLNLGCGHLPKKGYVNIDKRELPGVDIVSDVTDLPVGPDGVNEIFASHLIEHFPHWFLRNILLPYWHSLLKNEGKLHLILPDAEGMIHAYTSSEMKFDDLAIVTFGKQDYDGDYHFFMFSPDSISALLTITGFDDIEIIASNRPNGLCREMELVAFARKERK